MYIHKGTCPGFGTPETPLEGVNHIRTRNKSILLWLTQAELDTLNAQAKKCGLSKQAYLRMLLQSQSPKELPSVEHLDILRELRQINNNMNQIAMRANTLPFIDSVQYRENVVQLQAAIGKIMEALY